MRFLIVFATTEGHTRNLAAFSADRLRRVGHEVHICDAAQSDMADFARFGAALLIASVHLGRYQASLTKFARANHVALNAIRARSFPPCRRLGPIPLIPSFAIAWSV